jgi:hypothetical protein
MARELPRVLTALGAVIAAVGFTVFGMGMSYREPRDSDVTIGIALMVVGLAGFVVGLAMMRMSADDGDEVRVEPAQPARHEGDQ